MNSRPKKCGYPDCFNCSYSDCRYDLLEREEIFQQDNFDKSLDVVEPEIMARRKRQRKYNHSEKGKARQEKYAQSEKGKENEKRKRQGKIDSGKNAEYCRRYYHKRKMAMQSA